MAIQSRGQLVLADTNPTFSTRFTHLPDGYNLTGLFGTYADLYRTQLWVYVVINKLAYQAARLPLRAYRHTPTGRDSAHDTPYGQLLANPNSRQTPFFLWLWTVSTLNVYGEALWVKFRAGGPNSPPDEVAPLHPTNVYHETDPDTGKSLWVLTNGAGGTPRMAIPADDVVHFKTYNPDHAYRGLSPLEPLRLTLQTEFAARRAQAAYWKNGARPSHYLSTPTKLTDAAIARLKAQWDAVHSGVDNFGKTAILEEGMEPKSVSQTAEESAYIEERRLNREEVCAAYDVPPPAVHILDRATFSNITEQMRSVYRDTMAPRLKLMESTLASQLRPDFGDESLYAEFDMDDVLRGNYETRIQATSAAVNCGLLTPAEGRARENLPFAEGSDRLFVNSTMVPIDQAVMPKPPAVSAEMVPQPRTRSLSEVEMRALMGRLGRVAQLGDVDPDTLAQGMNGGSTFVKDAYFQARLLNEGVAGFKQRIAALLED